MSGIEKGKRDRVAKACATCRKKKIKCNGKNPCDHCKNLSLPCEYPNNKPRKSRSKVLLEMLQNRLDRLELLMHKMIDQMGGMESRNVPSPAHDIRPSADTLSTSSELPSLDASFKDEDVESQTFQSNGLVAKRTNGTLLPEKRPRDTFFQQAKSILSKTIDESSEETQRPHQILQYKGLHSGIVYIFSSQSIEWIKSRLRPEDHNIVTPFQTLLFYFNAWKQLFLSVWTDVKTYPKEDVKKLKEGVYPHDKQLTFELLKQYDCITLADFICPVEEVRALFVKYYANKLCPKLKKYRFSYSEFMLMNLSLAISISVAIDQKSTDVVTPGLSECPKLESMTIELLATLQEEMFLNSVFYFHTISAVSEGMVTIQALLLLATHLETTWVITDVNYSFVSMALRYAQEIGLHRFETFQHLPEEERNARGRLWAAVQCFDVEISHRTGKPPSVNMVDVSTLTPMDPWHVPSLLSTNEVKKLQLQCGAKRYSLEEIYVHFYVYKLSQLRAFSYFQLFSATVKYDSLKSIQDIVSLLNNELDSFLNEMKEEYRPRHYYEPQFNSAIERFFNDRKMTRADDSLLSLHLTFFYQLMTINKVPSQIEPNEGTLPYENTGYRKLSLDSARTILHIMRGVNRRCLPFFGLNWMIYYPFVAAMNLLAKIFNHSDDEDSYKDLQLLIDLSMNFFNHYSQQASQPSTRLLYLRSHLIDTLVRILLRICIKVFESTTGYDLLSGNPALRAHLEHVEKEFPQFYTKINDSTDLVNLMNCMHNTHEVKFREHKYTPLYDTSSNASNQEGFTPTYMENFESQSPRKNDPTLSNIIHPVDFPSVRESDRKDFNIDDDFLLAAVNQDFLTIPNFFFDNGL
ncbi:hypothetical protein C7M61_003574 [Candidozyma pseudohaemuli]|uniref:Zn(2)-C6 fungal-type domain-containing protein n=1 Tax=Candidozyma pseudohaemuli TaxID=418784 RepID=A0A2P7YME7_9ASCO|nr:hypothetical protein C7M61_003574 [[Candida] pseudohaemulonii]PSK37147.1 hypothetical protein C7M61_003574 [[Candida] pseudohaemulonii]